MEKAMTKSFRLVVCLDVEADSLESVLRKAWQDDIEEREQAAQPPPERQPR